MTWVDLNGNDRWDDEKHTARSEAWVRNRGVSHAREHILMRRTVSFLLYAFAQVLPDGNPMKPLLGVLGKPMTPDQFAEVSAAAQVFAQAEALKDAAVADAARLGAALDYEDAQAALASLPAPGDADPDVDRRATLRAQLAGATPDTLQLVADRAAYRQPVEPAADPTPEVQP